MEMPQPKQRHTHTYTYTHMHTCTCEQPHHSFRLSVVHMSLYSYYMQTSGQAIRKRCRITINITDVAPALRGLTTWLVELSNKELTPLLSSSRLCLKCFKSINSSGPQGLNDEVSINVIINRYHYYYYLTGKNTEIKR